VLGAVLAVGSTPANEPKAPLNQDLLFAIDGVNISHYIGGPSGPTRYGVRFFNIRGLENRAHQLSMFPGEGSSVVIDLFEVFTPDG
jgi:hypothetical protein